MDSRFAERDIYQGGMCGKYRREQSNKVDVFMLRCGHRIVIMFHFPVHKPVNVVVVGLVGAVALEVAFRNM